MREFQSGPAEFLPEREAAKRRFGRDLSSLDLSHHSISRAAQIYEMFFFTHAEPAVATVVMKNRITPSIKLWYPMA